MTIRIIADENADTEWVQALRGDGHDVARVVDIGGLGVGAGDSSILDVARQTGRVVLMADQADFAAPPVDTHPGVVLVTDPTRSGGEIRRALRRIERREIDLSGVVTYLNDWL